MHSGEGIAVSFREVGDDLLKIEIEFLCILIGDPIGRGLSYFGAVWYDCNCGVFCVLTGSYQSWSIFLGGILESSLMVA